MKETDSEKLNSINKKLNKKLRKIFYAIFESLIVNFDLNNIVENNQIIREKLKATIAEISLRYETYLVKTIASML